MSESIGVNNKMKIRLRKLLDSYDRIFIFETHVLCIRKLFYSFCQSASLADADKNILIMTTLEEDISMLHPNMRDYQRISVKEYMDILNIYYMYEFSNCIQIISDNYRYGSLFHYLITGILTEEEVFKAMLY